MAKTTKAPKGPVPLHYAIANGASLKEATSKLGGSKKDLSHKTNK